MSIKTNGRKHFQVYIFKIVIPLVMKLAQILDIVMDDILHDFGGLGSKPRPFLIYQLTASN